MKILLGITAGIAAYKTPELVRHLKKQGMTVRIVMTDTAKTFVTAPTLQALSGEPVYSDWFDSDFEQNIGHIQLARWPDRILIAPATANIIAKLAHGMADDLLSTICLATHAPITLAPAMNVAMWQHAATQANAALLQARGVEMIAPDIGEQACGEYGPGRLPDLEKITAHLLAQMANVNSLKDKTIVITAGPTHEYIDPVRYLSNPSTGKMGYALAIAAKALGAQVTLISGPTTLPPPLGVKVLSVLSASEMYIATQQQLPCDIFIAAAAVSDYRSATIATQKIKRSHDDWQITLKPNLDICKMVGHSHPKPFVVAFAAETENHLEFARQKLLEKKADLIIYNRVGKNLGFAADDNAVTLISTQQEIHLEKMPKQLLAVKIMENIASYARSV